MIKRVKAAHVVAIGVFLLLGVVFATDQEPNQNQNENHNSQNKNANRQSSNENRNANTGTQPNSTKNANQNENRTKANAERPASQNQTADEAHGARLGGSALSRADQKFIMDAAKGGMKEVELSRIAAERATNPNLKQFAQKMVDEHSRANEELMQIASSKGTLPTTPDEKLQQTINRLQGLSGAEFDRAYLKEAGLSEHEKAEKLFEQESHRGSDAEIRAFACKVLPTVQEHLRMIREIAAKQKTN